MHLLLCWNFYDLSCFDRILFFKKYDVCGYWVANVTEGIGIE